MGFNFERSSKITGSTIRCWEKTYRESIAAHALGLMHTNDDGDRGKLMYQGFNVRTATSATLDEVMGIYEKYC